MRVLLDRYAGAVRSLRLRSFAQLAVGYGVIVFGGFCIIAGAFTLLVPGKDAFDRIAALIVLVVLGLLPFLAGVFLQRRGLRGERLAARLRELSALARSRPSLSLDEVAHALQLSLLDAERLVLDAAALGLVDEPPPSRAFAPAPSYAQAAPYTPTPSYAPAASYAPTPPQAAGPLQAAGPQAPGLPQAAGPPQAAPAAGGWSGRVLGGSYRVEGPLGAGGMGAVFAARHVRTGRRYAVKVLLPGARLSPEAVQRFEREAVVAGGLGHPGIVAVHDFNREPDGTPYLVMDLLEGETLEARLLRVGSLRWPEARQLGLEVSAALGAAHDAGLLHRDLKPSNIFLVTAKGASERAVLIDFGLAKPLDQASPKLTASGAVVGTPLYMSPEQAQGEPLDVRSDLYSLGAVLYECLTGAPPFFDQTLARVYARLLQEPSPRPSALAPAPLPPAVDALFERALAKSRHQRFDSARALAEALWQTP